MILKPIGNKLLIEPQEKKNFKTEGGLEVVQSELSEGIIIEVSDEYSGIYEKGNLILYNADAGKPEYYNGKSCQWIDGRSTANGGDVWAIILNGEQ